MMRIHQSLTRPAGHTVLRRSLASLKFDVFGVPSQTLSLDAAPATATQPSNAQVKVTMHSSPITTEDIRRIRGQSLVDNTTGLGGVVGVGRVASTGSDVSNVKENDLVLVSGPCWADSVTVSANNVVKLPNISADEANAIPAIVSALGILRSLPGLKEGDTVLQTGGANCTGDALSQVGAAQGVKIVSVPDSELMDVTKLKALGKSNHGVAGASTSKVVHQMTKALRPNGSVVFHHGTYQSFNDLLPIDLPASAAIFNNISVRGFNLYAWIKNDPTSFAEQVEKAAQLLKDKKIALPSQQFSLNDYKQAIEAAETSGSLNVLKLK